MGSITYKDVEGTGKPTTWRGVQFEPGKAVKVEDPGMLAKASNNPHFEVSGYKPDTQAQVMGDYTDPLTGGTVTLVRQQRAGVYGGAAPSTAGVAGVSSDTTITTSRLAANPVAAAPDLEASLVAAYGTANPLESQEPGKPPAPSAPAKEVVEHQREQQKEQQKRGPKPGNRR